MTDNGACKVIFPGWGSTETVENLDESPHSQTVYYQHLVSSLIKHPFYIRNKTLRGTPYDFRRSPNENGYFFVRLKTLIEETYANSDNLPVVIVGHSLGSLYSLEFLKRQTDFWKEKYIKAFLSVSGPHGGSVKALKLEISGGNLGDPFHSGISFRDVQRSMPSTAYLLPNPRLWPPSETIVVTPTANYSAHDLQKLFSDMNFELGYRMMKNTQASANHFVGPTAVKELYCIHGSAVETTNKIVYQLPALFGDAFPDQSPSLVFEEGDGTVHKRSLEVCKNWSGAKHIVLPGAEHVKILGDPRFIDIVHEASMGYDWLSFLG